MDNLSIDVRSDDYVKWNETNGFQPIQLIVNGQNLLDLITEIEKPYVEKENQEEGNQLRAGDYFGLGSHYAHVDLMGKPFNHGFMLDEDDPLNRKSLIYGCTCGISECWAIVAEITVEEKTVTWKNFCQFHRDWEYRLGPFTFEKEEYLKQIEGLTRKYL